MRIIKLVLSAAVCMMSIFTSNPYADESRIRSTLSYNEVQAALFAQAIETVQTNSAVPAFLKTTGFLEAWALLKKDVTATIAIIDTGVDFNSPELKSYLLPGKNLINDRKPPQDDNGHGTAVAGIIAAVAKAGGGISQAKWKGLILPVKALDHDGAGDEGKLTQAIRYSVDQGANIIVLSLGLRRDAPDLRAAVSYAESKGVLLVAASGNDAAIFGEKAEVQYPAAYPSVLSVAGSNGNHPVSQSTSGSENDISAAWKVQTLAIGGGTVETVGTSMGAPQVAAAAAMLMAVYPDWKPLRIRETLRRSAQRNAATSWDEQLGYGFVAVNKALQASLQMDWREPNNTRNSPSVFPLGKEVSGSWGSSADLDWYTIDIPYDGIFTLSGDNMNTSLHGNEGQIEPRAKPPLLSTTHSQWEVKKGRYWLEASSAEATPLTTKSYRIVSQFIMAPDIREPNDSAATALTLPARSQKWTGSFHKQGDEDWFAVTLPSAGTLKITLTTDTTRIDPKLWVQPAGGAAVIVDEGGDGISEKWSLKAAKTGKYFLRVTNAVSSNPEAVIGTYAASLEYITEKDDAFEPNNGALTSTPFSPDKVYYGLMNTNKDQDWYRITLKREQKVKLSLGFSSHSSVFHVELRNKKLQTLKKWNTESKQQALFREVTLLPGVYYINVTSDKAIKNQGYGIRVKYINN